MSTLILQSKNKKSTFTPAQKTFNANCRKIDRLNEQLKTVQTECEFALGVYHSEIKQKEKFLSKMITDFLLKVIDITKSPKALYKNERETLEEFLASDLKLLYTLVPYEEVPLDIRVLYKEIFGKTAEKEAFDIFKDLFDLNDLPDVDIEPGENLEDIFEKFKSSFDQDEFFADGDNFDDEDDFDIEDTVFNAKPKSKKALLKEKQAGELQELQTKGMGLIYKRLVKEFHPDLEQDKEKRTEKEALMKLITTSYDNRDLVSLISLESKFLKKSTDSFDNDTVKIYNTVLKDQIKELEEKIEHAFLDPRYHEIHHILQLNPTDPVYAINEFSNLRALVVKEYTKRLDDISKKNSLQTLKLILSKRERKNKQEFDMEGLFEFFLKSSPL